LWGFDVILEKLPVQKNKLSSEGGDGNKVNIFMVKVNLLNEKQKEGK
jgi:hypothetical protein